jgi:hypothetical protein
MPTRVERIEAARRAQLREVVPGLFGPGTLLYVGASVRRAQFLRELMGAGRRVTVLEAHGPNVEHFRSWPGLQVVEGDVREVGGLVLPEEDYDVAFWWHGPEHVAARELAGTLRKLEERARVVVLGCPWGLYPQVGLEGNPFEQHRLALQPEDLQALGYRTWTLGRTGGRADSNILAVRP